MSESPAVALALPGSLCCPSQEAKCFEEGKRVILGGSNINASGIGLNKWQTLLALPLSLTATHSRQFLSLCGRLAPPELLLVCCPG